MSPRTTLTVIAALMKTEGVGVVPVVDPENRVVGVVTDRDIVIRGIDDQNAFFTTEVRQIMTKAPATVLAGETIVNALALMGGLGVKRLPVVNEENVLIGILALADVVTRTDYSQEVNDTVERIAGNRPA